MNRSRTGRHSLALIVSIAIHAGLALALLLTPKTSRKHWDTVDLTVSKKEPEQKPPPPPEPEPEVETEKEPDKPKPVKPKNKKAEPSPSPPPPDEPPPEEPPEEEAPPVFDLGDNTFAKGAQGVGWKLARSEGNTKFGKVAGKSQKSLRGTKVKNDPSGKPGGTGFDPVPNKNLSKRPKIKGGSAKTPPYPKEAAREGIEGKAVVQVFIGKDGKVKKVRIIKDPGGGCGAAAVASMKKETFEPARDKQGRPVDTIITWTYRFVLDG